MLRSASTCLATVDSSTVLLVNVWPMINRSIVHHGAENRQSVHNSDETIEIREALQSTEFMSEVCQHCPDKYQRTKDERAFTGTDTSVILVGRF